ncbi:hypothetical protein [Brevundimonas aveniformis]|uniref:hypothetical protein n=1 Tax=Brevundimonas aveniformis TaxID=370977 RepID=UPI00248FA3D8|nr:hypothetical protein [Brevundimonas aveniformis]
MTTPTNNQQPTPASGDSTQSETDKQQLRDVLGDGTAGQAADAAEKHNQKNEDALNNVDNP